ncbi:MAG TPA: type II toxin-antitoxin system RelE/ParE family toxin [Xanthobacteraceae bacterium]|jgi:plasmid stabilization system protein ParE
MLPYDLTPSALADLEEIARYTLRQWGEQRMMLYAAALDRCFERIAEGSAVHRNFSPAFPQIRVTRCERHYVFFLRAESGRVRIVAVLHERMALLARLRQRLG